SQPQGHLAGGAATGGDLETGEVAPVQQEDAEDEEHPHQGLRQGAQDEHAEDHPQDRQCRPDQVVEKRGERAAADARHRQVETDVVQPQDAFVLYRGHATTSSLSISQAYVGPGVASTRLQALTSPALLSRPLPSPLTGRGGRTAEANEEWRIRLAKAREGLPLALLRLARHRDEEDGQDAAPVEAAVAPSGEDPEVLVAIAHRDDHPGAGLELAQQGVGDARRRGGDDDAVEGSRRRPSLVAVADAE